MIKLVHEVRIIDGQKTRNTLEIFTTGQLSTLIITITEARELYTALGEKLNTESEKKALEGMLNGSLYQPPECSPAEIAVQHSGGGHGICGRCGGTATYEEGYRPCRYNAYGCKDE